MDGARTVSAAYARLVPATLLPPQDPFDLDVPPRTVRDWTVDVLLFLLCIGLGVLFLLTNRDAGGDRPTTALQIVDAVSGTVACLALWFRRRWPTEIGVLTAVLSVASTFAAPASVVGLFSVAVHRRTPSVIAVFAVNLVVSALFVLIRPQPETFLVTMAISVGIATAIVAWGMFIRARRQLVWTLRDRAERAEADQQVHAERARLAERTRIAREMHDVLAHRLSLVALHAGGLQVRPDLPADEVRETAALLRSTARQALEELRGVIGVLRDDAAPGNLPTPPPQPTLRDIPRLVSDTRRTGARIDFHLEVPDDADAPAALGRDAYRIVQEALTNVAKHATGTATTVEVSGAPGSELHVRVRNLLPIGRPVSSALPGAGAGLLGLGERVHLAGGTLEHGPDGDGSFVVDARLTWPAGSPA